MYSEKELVGIAKRENNNRRKYLVVNRLQGKHIPVIPSKAINMFDCLAQMLIEKYSDEKLLLIGFAETATAIGAAVATQMDCYYMQTTREVINNVDYLFFSETHSHATEQKLVKNDIESIIYEIDRIIFIEDEVTTGNTIMNIVKLIQNEYKNSKSKFSIASILNGMNSDAEKLYRSREIGIHYLVKTNHDTYDAVTEKFVGDGKYNQSILLDKQAEYKTKTYGEYVNARRLVKSSVYLKACEKLWDNIKGDNDIKSNIKILVLGTEEFMYPSIFIAHKMELVGCDVRFHATTRSPIVVSSEEDYPLHTRYELCSLYDAERTTFVYELTKYDRVFIITDALNDKEVGLNSLIFALTKNKNDNISVIRWC
ncbi:MAG: phosphoribosyltransferase domain-containing protein [Lachnotalea sp.]